MSVRKQVERALRRSESRDRKHTAKMRVSGKNVFMLSKLIGRKTNK
jgi:hypothetical protein